MRLALLVIGEKLLDIVFHRKSFNTRWRIPSDCKSWLLFALCFFPLLFGLLSLFLGKLLPLDFFESSIDSLFDLLMLDNSVALIELVDLISDALAKRVPFTLKMVDLLPCPVIPVVALLKDLGQHVHLNPLVAFE